MGPPLECNLHIQVHLPRFMAFADFQKHCRECKKGKPCGKFHIYVMTVDPRLKVGKKSKKVRFRKINPDTHQNGKALYVGKCECSPRCRQSKHRNYNSKKPTKWSCYCGKYESNNLYQQYQHMVINLIYVILVLFLNIHFLNYDYQLL